MQPMSIPPHFQSKPLVTILEQLQGGERVTQLPLPCRGRRRVLDFLLLSKGMTEFLFVPFHAELRRPDSPGKMQTAATLSLRLRNPVAAQAVS